MESQFGQILSKFDELTQKLTDEAVLKDPRRYQQVARERKELEEVVAVVVRLQEILKTIDDNREVIAAGDDPELAELAREEMTELENDYWGRIRLVENDSIHDTTPTISIKLSVAS